MDDPVKPQEEPQGHGLRWHLTRLIAALAIGFCAFIVGAVIGLVISGPDFVTRWFDGIGGIVMWAVALLSLPFVYKRLR